MKTIPPPWITPEVLRKAADELNPEMMQFLCFEIAKQSGSRRRHLSVGKWFTACGFVKHPMEPLAFKEDMHAFPYETEQIFFKASCRFMLCEFLALALEDGCL